MNYLKGVSLTNALKNNSFNSWYIILYNKLTNIKYLAKGEFSTVYNAIWLDGYIWGWNNGRIDYTCSRNLQEGMSETETLKY